MITRGSGSPTELIVVVDVKNPAYIPQPLYSRQLVVEDEKITSQHKVLLRKIEGWDKEGSDLLEHPSNYSIPDHVSYIVMQSRCYDPSEVLNFACITLSYWLEGLPQVE